MQQLVTELHQERQKREADYNSRQLSMADEGLKQKKEMEELEEKYRVEMEEKHRKLEEQWKLRFEDEKQRWKDTMRQMYERENYLTERDEVFVSDELAHKLGADLQLEVDAIRDKIAQRENDVKFQLNQFVRENNRADQEYIDTLEEIERLKEELR